MSLVLPFRPRQRFAGTPFRLANEDAKPPLPGVPANLRVLDAKGNALNFTLSNAGDQPTLTLANASAALAAVPDVRLTSFAQGWPEQAYDVEAAFLAPYVQAAFRFTYVVNPKTNIWATTADDTVGPGGMPRLIKPDPQGVVLGELVPRGMETFYTETDQKLAEATPGDSLALLQERRTRLVTAACRGGRYVRVVAAFAAATPNPTSINWGPTNTGANPLKDLRDRVRAVAKEMGGKQYVAVLLGADAWDYFVSSPKIGGGAYYANQDIDEVWLARKLGIPPENVRISYLQVVTSAQGQNAATSYAWGAGDIAVFGRNPKASTDDPTFMKTFAMQMSGGWYGVYSYVPHPQRVFIGLNYNEVVAVTNSAAVARFSVTFT